MLVARYTRTVLRWQKLHVQYPSNTSEYLSFPPQPKEDVIACKFDKENEMASTFCEFDFEVESYGKKMECGLDVLCLWRENGDL